MAIKSNGIKRTLDPLPPHLSVSLGFTLFELLVVLVIIGLMSAFVLPKLSGHLKSITVKTAAKKVASSLRLARYLAVSEKVTVVTDFNLETNQLRINAKPHRSVIDTEPKPEKAYNVNRLISKDNVYALPEGTQFVDNTSNAMEKVSIIFHPNGSSSGGQIVVTDNRKKKFIILVDPITGSTKISN